MGDRTRGFTLVELVTALVTLGVVAAVAAPRFFARSVYDERAAADRARATIAVAQRLALASGCDTRVRVTTSTLSAEQWSACTPASHAGASAVVEAPGGGALVVNAPSGVAFSTADWYFDALGRPRDSSTGVLVTAAIIVSIGGSRSVRIEPQTGFARAM